MFEKKIEMKTFDVRAMCICGGEFEIGNVTLTSHPPKYPATCNQCGACETLNRRYPYLHHVPAGATQ